MVFTRLINKRKLYSNPFFTNIVTKQSIKNRSEITKVLEGIDYITNQQTIKMYFIILQRVSYSTIIIITIMKIIITILFLILIDRTLE